MLRARQVAKPVKSEVSQACSRRQIVARHEQAKAWVEQVKTILEVSEIALREYRDGVYPQDRELIRQYITTCRTELQRAEDSLEWSRQAMAKGIRAASQVRVDELSYERAEIALNDALVMQERLERYTAPRLIKSLEA